MYLCYPVVGHRQLTLTHTRPIAVSPRRRGNPGSEDGYAVLGETRRTRWNGKTKAARPPSGSTAKLGTKDNKQPLIGFVSDAKNCMMTILDAAPRSSSALGTALSRIVGTTRGWRALACPPRQVPGGDRRRPPPRQSTTTPPRRSSKQRSGRRTWMGLAWVRPVERAGGEA